MRGAELTSEHEKGHADWLTGEGIRQGLGRSIIAGAAVPGRDMGREQAMGEARVREREGTALERWGERSGGTEGGIRQN